MQEANLEPLGAKHLEVLGKLADKLKTTWQPFPGLRMSIIEFHRHIQEIYERIDAFVLKVEYLEQPTRDDFVLIRDLIAAVQYGIQDKHLLEETLRRKILRHTPKEYILRTKSAIKQMQKILKFTEKLLELSRNETLRLLTLYDPELKH